MSINLLHHIKINKDNKKMIYLFFFILNFKMIQDIINYLQNLNNIEDNHYCLIIPKKTFLKDL